MNSETSIRPARENDLPAITAIYNDAILKTVATFDTDTKQVSDMKEWYNNHDEKYPVLVAEKNGQVTGYASLSRWSDRCAYGRTAEISVYVDENYRGQGIGKMLIASIIEAGEKAGLHTVI